MGPEGHIQYVAPKPSSIAPAAPAYNTPAYQAPAPALAPAPQVAPAVGVDAAVPAETAPAAAATVSSPTASPSATPSAAAFPEAVTVSAETASSTEAFSPALIFIIGGSLLAAALVWFVPSGPRRGRTGCEPEKFPLGEVQPLPRCPGRERGDSRRPRQHQPAGPFSVQA